MELKVDIRKRLKGFSLNIDFETSEEVLGILGASGSGKSMTLRCIAGIDTPDSGRIILNGKVLYDSEKGINLPSRERKTGFLFQNYALFPHMTVEDNIGFALHSISAEDRRMRIRRNIEMMKLGGLEKRYPGQLSGGQQQRVALARALAIEPEILLLDEPFSALDEYLRMQMVKQLAETLEGYKGITLFVTHNMEEAYRICNNLVIMNNGVKEASGSKEQIFSNPPTLVSARITGCKNISGAEYLSDGVIKADKWNCRLKIGHKPAGVSYVGIRANHIRFADETTDENTFNCWPAYTSEAPFRTTVFLNLNNPAQDTLDYQIQWEMSKDRWLEIKDKPLPWKIYLNPDKLILI